MPEVTNKDSNNLKVTPFQPQSETKKCVDDLVTKTRQFDMIYGGFRANHNVHVFYSIYALGGTPEDCERYYKDSKTYLEPAKSPTKDINEDNWESQLADKEAYSSYLRFFEKEVQSKGIEASFNKYLPRLIPGLAGAALHPLIHLGYAFEFKDDRVASEGLAYAAAHYLPLGELIDKVKPSESTHSALDQITGFLCEKEPIDLSETSNGLFGKLDAVTKHYGDRYALACDGWSCTTSNVRDRLEDLTLATIKIFGGSYRQKTLDFFLLHSLTGNNAVTKLLPLLEPHDQVRLLNLNFLALSLLFTTQSRPSLHSNLSPFNSESSLDANYDWSKIVTRACNSTDSHVIKGVRYCHDLESEFGFHGGLFRTVAYQLVEDVLANGWCFKGIGLLSKDN